MSPDQDALKLVPTAGDVNLFLIRSANSFIWLQGRNLQHPSKTHEVPSVLDLWSHSYQSDQNGLSRLQAHDAPYQCDAPKARTRFADHVTSLTTS